MKAGSYVCAFFRARSVRAMADVIKFPAVNVRDKHSSGDEPQKRNENVGAKILMFSGVRIERYHTRKPDKIVSDGYRYK